MSRLETYVQPHNFSYLYQKTNTSWGDRAYANVAPKLWNGIPLQIRQSPSVDVFKKRLKSHLFET